MWQTHSSIIGPSRSPGMALETIWDVDADPTYVVHRNIAVRRTHVAAITLRGSGVMRFARRDDEVVVGRNQLILFELGRVRHYRCEHRRWRFWWFEFLTSVPLMHPAEEPLDVTPHRGDRSLFDQAFAALRRDDSVARAFASAGFATLLHRWLSTWSGRRADVPHHRAIELVIDMMHERLESPWSVAAMADAAHLGERRFRQVFRAATGRTPKRFYESLRLDHGRRLLELGIYTVKEVARRLGYSSQFHFSREYRKQFGWPPARTLAGARPKGGGVSW